MGEDQGEPDCFSSNYFSPVPSYAGFNLMIVCNSSSVRKFGHTNCSEPFVFECLLLGSTALPRNSPPATSPRGFNCLVIFQTLHLGFLCLNLPTPIAQDCTFLKILSANSTLHFQKLLLRPPLPVSIIQLFFEACSTNILVQISPANSSIFGALATLKNSLQRFPLPVPTAGFVFKAFQSLFLEFSCASHCLPHQLLQAIRF